MSWIYKLTNFELYDKTRTVKKGHVIVFYDKCSLLDYHIISLVSKSDVFVVV